MLIIFSSVPPGAHNHPSASSSSFDGLPDDVIGRIFGNLCLGDRTRMKLVCRSWSDTLTRAEFLVRPEPPWLILPSDEPFLTFESPADGRTYRRPFPPRCHLHQRWSCRGSGDGWLLLVGHSPCHDITEMVLWDPLWGATRDLPPLSTLPFFDELATGCFENHGLDISSPLVTNLARVSSAGPTVAVAVVFSLFENHPGRKIWERLVVCFTGDPTWAVLPNIDETMCYSDILFHNGRLFVVCAPWDLVGTRPFMSKTSTCTVGDMEVVTCELRYEAPSSAPHENYTGFEVGFEVWQRWNVAEHLVGSADEELLLVNATLDLFTHNFDLGKPWVYKCPQTRGFEVRRLSLLNNSADGLVLILSEKVERTGERCIYLGETGSTIMEGVSDEPNCIRYATADGLGVFWNLGNEEEDEVDVDIDSVWTIHERGFFNVAEGRIRRTCSANTSARSGSCSGWFTPAFGRERLDW